MEKFEKVSILFCWQYKECLIWSALVWEKISVHSWVSFLELTVSDRSEVKCDHTAKRYKAAQNVHWGLNNERKAVQMHTVMLLMLTLIASDALLL